MNPDVKQQWLTALRSGTYKQTKLDLRVSDSFCCLGVLCDISKVGSWSNDGIFTDKNPLPGHSFYLDTSASRLTNSVVGWAGFLSKNPAISIAKKEYSLASLNDDGFTFEQIADLIEYFL